jgi:DNA-directed RNA polymerase specialized sigma24 family protein
MSGMIARIAAEAEKNFLRPVGFGSEDRKPGSPQRTHGNTQETNVSQELDIDSLAAHQFPGRTPQEHFVAAGDERLEQAAQKLADILREYEEIESEEEHRRRRIYRGRTVTMLRRYLKYSIETGRLPSLLGQEFFRAKVTTYSVVTFEDRVIFVHDMERCLQRLDEFSRELIARHVLQEHDRWATARLLHCSEKTVRRLAPVALDQLCEIMLEVGLMERQDAISEKSCQGGLESEISVSDCEESENNF